mmetsp:Transcript_28529/g.66111  ORF Transcript_28529/g.66111 Transcript_28529/m.66111 type:complete len:617 (+) Transcript_28529:53-1903(+)
MADGHWAQEQAFGFQRLPAVQTIRPRLPEAEEEELRAITVHRDGQQESPADKLSPAIQKLIDQLAYQHLLELKMASSDWPPKSSHANVSRGSPRSDDSSAAPSPQESVLSPGNQTKRRISQIMCKQKEGVRRLSAESVVKEFEENKETKKLAKAKTMAETLNALEDGQSGSESQEMDGKAEPPALSLMERTQIFLQSNKYELLIASLLSLNVLWMAVELQLAGSVVANDIGIYQAPLLDADSWLINQEIFPLGDLFFTIIFALDVFVRIIILKRQFWRVGMNYLDVAVTAISLIELVVVYSSPNLLEDVNVNPVLFRLLRLGKLARAVRMVTMNSVLNSLQILTRCLASSTTMLFWSFCLLTFFQCVFGMVASTLCRDFITDKSQDLQLREEVFLYFGTFTRTFLTMFEILFANWAVPCRLLMENISEWFSTFFLVYRCLLGFAVLNVVNAVFVQQTMKIASSDEELAFKQKEKELASYTRKVKKLFQTMDQSGDGSINFEEFSKLVQSPMLQFLLSQLDLEYHDLLSLFEFLDNGDGEITLTEFIEGAAKLRGSAKALDIWRMETKLEVLFGEVLAAIKGDVGVRDVFEKLKYRHLTFTTGSAALGRTDSEAEET